MALSDYLDVEPEQLAGSAVGSVPLAVMATQGINPDLSKVPSVTAEGVQRASRAGDIMITRGKEPFSGFRLAVPAITGSPYYHAEQIWTSPTGRKLHGISGDQVGGGITPYVSDQESVMLMRPRHLPKGRDKQLREIMQKLLKEDYSHGKAFSAGVAGIGVPQSKFTGDLPILCRGDVCSTTPATVRRLMGLETGTRAMPSFELSGDYLRSKDWKPVATFGPRPSRYYQAFTTLPARALMAGALGGATYKTVKDVREGKTMAPVAGAVGAGAGGFAGSQLDALFQSIAGDEPAVGRQIAKQVERVPGINPARARGVGRGIAEGMAGIHYQAPLIPSFVGAIVGGLSAYALAKLVYKLADKNKAKS